MARPRPAPKPVVAAAKEPPKKRSPSSGTSSRATSGTSQIRQPGGGKVKWHGSGKSHESCGGGVVWLLSERPVRRCRDRPPAQPENRFRAGQADRHGGQVLIIDSP